MDFAAMRRRMIDNQILTNRIVDRPLIDAMAAVPRELFVPKPLQGVAYVDEDLALAEGRYLIEPLVTARLVQALAVRPNDVVLDLGCATGYTSAILARLASTVVGLESDPAMIETANRVLQQLAIDNVAIIQGPLVQGAPRQGPFDAILIGGGATEVPQPILDQLGEGGRLACVLRRDHLSPGRVVMWERLNGVLSHVELADAGTPYLPGFFCRPAFSF